MYACKSKARGNGTTKNINIYIPIKFNKTDMKTPLENAYETLSKLEIPYNSELHKLMCTLATEAFGTGYDKAVKNTKEVYEKVYEL